MIQWGRIWITIHLTIRLKDCICLYSLHTMRIYSASLQWGRGELQWQPSGGGGGDLYTKGFGIAS